MPSNANHKIQFYVSGDLYEKFISKYPIDQRNEIAKSLFVDFINGNSTTPNTSEQSAGSDLDSRLKKIRAADLTLKVWDRMKQSGWTLDQLESLVNDGQIPYAESESITPEQKQHLPTFGKTITHRPQKILQEDGTLRCKHCNKKIEMRVFDFEQLDDYRKHVVQVHGQLDESERIELLGIYPN